MGFLGLVAGVASGMALALFRGHPQVASPRRRMSARARSSGALAAGMVAGLGVRRRSRCCLLRRLARPALLYPLLAALVAAIALAAVVWFLDTAYTLSAADLPHTPLAGNWEQLGVPQALSPDRLLFAGAIVAVLLRSPPVADRPRIEFTRTHWPLGLAASCHRIRLLGGDAVRPRPGAQNHRRVRDPAVPRLLCCPAGVQDSGAAQRVARHARGTRRLPGAHRVVRDAQAGRARVSQVRPR